MNAPHKLPTSAKYECVKSHWYIFEPDDFPEGCGIVMCADTGKQWGIGKTRLGHTVRLRLYTPLCDGCDNPIPESGVCHDCEVIHTDIGGIK